MNINSAFPSKFLKASDLGGAEPIVTIDRVTEEEVGEDKKPVVYFQGKEKGVVLNKTNAMNIAEAYGPETTNWRDQKVVLFTTWVDFQGKSVEAIRIRPAKANEKPRGTVKNPAPPNFDSENPAAGVDDDIPF